MSLRRRESLCVLWAAVIAEVDTTTVGGGRGIGGGVGGDGGLPGDNLGVTVDNGTAFAMSVSLRTDHELPPNLFRFIRSPILPWLLYVLVTLMRFLDIAGL